MGLTEQETAQFRTSIEWLETQDRSSQEWASALYHVNWVADRWAEDMQPELVMEALAALAKMNRA